MRKNYYVLVFVILSLVVISTILMVKFTLITAQVFVTLSGWLVFSVRLLYSKWEWFYLKVQQARFILTNPDTTWNMVIRYQCELTQEKILSLRDYFLKINDVKVISLSSGDVEVRFEGMTFQVFLDEDELEIHLLNLPVTYNKSLNILEKILCPMLEDIESIVQPKKRTYFLKVSFDGINPYYGLYLNKIPKNSILDFDVKFIVDKSKVEITKDSVILTSERKSHLTNLSRDYLTLSPNKS